ncbi:MAG: DUF2752 domain-containing protein [Clostridiales Family XIII bacterium]|jgi:hypothetical protein|nr:DUF2752 domain-containing protein [Clostridiales Family XIII bacterium]
MKRLAVLLSAVGVAFCFAVGCPFKLITGIPCPGCGMTRAFLSAAQLDFRSAFAYHPLFPIIPVCAVLLILWVLRRAAAHRIRLRQLRARDIDAALTELMDVAAARVAVALLVVLFAALYAARMLVTLSGVGGAWDMRILL